MDDCPIVFARCAICGAHRDLVTVDTWFFVGGPKACKHVCSRECLAIFAQRLLLGLEGMPRAKPHGG